jgi:hypothetical protein
MLILVLLSNLFLLLNHKLLNIKVAFNRVDILKLVISRKFISSACRE